MKRLLLLTTFLSVAQINAADPPSKRGGGLFGFGSQKPEQISSGLFPEHGYAAAPSDSIVTTSSGSASNGGTEIFKSGQPQQVNAVSYVIQNGRKIEKPIESAPTVAAPAPVAAVMTPPTAESGVELASDDGRKKGGLFSFGRRNDAVEKNEVVTPVPAGGGFAPPRATPPMTAAPVPVPVVAAPAIPAKPAVPAVAPVQETAETPNFAGVKKEKEEKSSWIPFLNRKKQEPETAMPVASSAPAVVAAAEPVPAAAAPVAAIPAKPAATTAVNTTAAPSTTFEVPRDDSKKEEKKEAKPGASGAGILSPIAKIRPPRKDIDLSSAETIIQDGEIVAGTETNFETVSETGTTGQRQAPQVVNGVKTYSSWDDVNARSSSAADKIIGSMR